MQILQRFRSDKNLKKSELLDRWRYRFKNSQHKYADHYNRIDRWASLMDDNLYKFTGFGDSDTKGTQVNECKSVIYSIIPVILGEPPITEVRSYSVRNVRMAAIWERVAEYVDRKYDLFEEFLWAVYNALLYGNGILKIGYWDDALIDKPMWGSGISQAFNTVIAAYADNVEIKEIFPDLRALRWSKQRYIIHQVPMHMDDLIGNDDYNQSVVKKLVPTHSSDKVFEYSPPDENVENEYVYVQEIHDLSNRRVFLMNKNVNDWIFEGNEPYGINPYENLMFMHRPRCIWGDSITQTIEPHVKSMSEAVTYLNNRLAIEGVIKVLLRLQDWDPESIEEMKRAKNSFVGLETDDVSQSYHVVDYSTAKGQFIFEQSIATYKELIRALTGVTQQEQGSHEAGVETALEASMLKTASSLRNSFRNKMFNRFASRVIGKLLYVISLQYPPERIAMMAGLPPFYANEIADAGPYDETKFELDYGATAMNSRMERLQKLAMLKQLVGEQYINPAVMAGMVLENMDFDWAQELVMYEAVGLGSSQSSLPTIMPEQAKGLTASMAQTRIAPGQGSPPSDMMLPGGM